MSDDTDDGPAEEAAEEAAEVEAEVASALIDEGIAPAEAAVIAADVADAVEVAEIGDTVEAVVAEVTGDPDIAEAAGITAEVHATIENITEAPIEPAAVAPDPVVESVAEVAPVTEREPDRGPQRDHWFWRPIGRR